MFLCYRYIIYACLLLSFVRLIFIGFGLYYVMLF
nr:MAG TPA: hypothetical protein [Caudoviricetes sp.]